MNSESPINHSDIPKIPNFQSIEKKWNDFWEKEGIYKFNISNTSKPVYSIDTPPPTISGMVHVGHVMSYGQADFIARYRRMREYNVFYPMGFDDNGLPTERFVEKKIGINAHDLSREEFIGKVSDEVRKGTEEFIDCWKRIGLSVDWDYTYSTISPKVQKIAQKSFIDLYRMGRAYRSKDVVIWCPSCKTALSQADLETRVEKTSLNYITFKLDSGKDVEVATTRPEMLSACVSLFVNREDDRYHDIIGKTAQVPLSKQIVPVLADEDVDKNFGSGVLMVCTFGDKDDVKRWRKHKLPTRIAIDDEGRLNKNSGTYVGKDIRSARKNIINDLFDEGFITKQEQITHDIPIHERCENPIEYNIKNQWFIRILDLKRELMEQADKISWYPDNMKARYLNWVKDLNWDWAISRQRPYGVPIPVWYCNSCGEIILADEGELPVEPSLSNSRKSCRCGKGSYVPEEDVMDTWMVSSLTPLINAGWNEGQNLMDRIYPFSLRPQAHDIIRTWAFYTILKSYLHTSSIPWKNIMVSGHGLDEQGKKMSKSKGNVILPSEVIEKYSADSLRWWASGIKLGEDLAFQEKDLVEGRNLMIKVWNVYRFASPHLHEISEVVKHQPIDKWILSRANDVVKLATEDFENYEYNKARSRIRDFFWNDICDNYIELIKPRLYDNNVERESSAAAKNTLYKLLLTTIKLLSPFMPHLTEEIYQNIYRDTESYKSIHISPWPKENETLNNREDNELGEVEIQILSAIRQWKQKNRIPLGNVVEKLTISYPDPEKVKKISSDLSRALKIESLAIEEGELAVR